MSLGLEIRKGIPKHTPIVLDSGALTREDVERRNERSRGLSVEPLKRLGARHHELARLIANGSTPGVAALAVGLTPARVGQLCNDPTFKDLLSHYETLKEAAFADYQKLAAALGEESLRVLLERLEDTPTEFEVGDLLNIAKVTGDRTGHAPKREVTSNININIGDRLEAARRRAVTETFPRTLEHVSDAEIVE